MKKDAKAFLILFKQYANHQIDKPGFDLLFGYIKKSGTDALEPAMDEDWATMDMDFPLGTEQSDALYQRIVSDGRFRKTTDTIKKKNRILSWWRYSAAAALLLIIAGFFFYQYRKPNAVEPMAQRYADDVAPGGHQAILRVGDGAAHQLENTQTGIEVGNGKILYANGSSLPIESTLGKQALSLQTPKGGIYQLTLPDGSRVWLNAASELKFPSSFRGEKERKVVLSGEAYFEVAKNAAQPFIVVFANQEARVLGTHFNISSYADENTRRTSLLEGALAVSNTGRGEGNQSVVLKPGQQAVSGLAGGLSIQPVNGTDAIAWKDGLFVFENEKLESIMRKIARWYNVEVVFDGHTSTEGFDGTISRFENVSEVLKMLELTELVHFKIEGRKITVMR